MANVSGGGSVSIALPPLHQVILTASSVGAASVARLGNRAGEAPISYTEVSAGQTLRVGPFGIETRHRIASVSGEASYSIEPVDFQSPEEIAASSGGALALQALDAFHTGDGETDAFSLTGGAGLTAAQTQVFVDGLRQGRNADYSVADDGDDLVVTFSAPPAENAKVHIFAQRSISEE